MFSEAHRYTWSIVLVDMIFGNMLIRRRKKNKHTTGIVFLRNRYITELLHDKNPLEMFNTCDLMISVSFDCFRWPLINLRSYQAVLSVNTDKCYRIRTIGPLTRCLCCISNHVVGEVTYFLMVIAGTGKRQAKAGDGETNR